MKQASVSRVLPRFVHVRSQISFQFWQVAKVVSVEAVENSDKLWKCQVNVGGDETRQVVAGLQPYISKEVMEGLVLVVICNLKPAKLAGEVSEAMILAATSSEDSSVVRTLQPPAGCKPGDKVQRASLTAHRTLHVS